MNFTPFAPFTGPFAAPFVVPFQDIASNRRAFPQKTPPTDLAPMASALPDAPCLDTRILAAAFDLHQRGLNVLPIPRVGMEEGGKKPPYGDTRRFETARLHPPLFPELFAGSNLAVMVGRLSGNLFVLDCDSMEAFNWVRSELATRGIAAWVSQGARGGHFWLRGSEGVVTSCKPQSDMDVKGDSGYVVAPPSVHPTGALYEWVSRQGEGPPVISVKALDFLSLQVQRQQTSELPFVANRVLVEGDNSGYRNDASAAEFAAVLSLTRAGYKEEEIVALFEEHAPPHFASRKSPAAWLCRYVLPKAREIVAAGSSSTPQRHPHAAREWALSRPWSGRGAMSDRCVFLALCQRAEQERREPFRASLRELAERANGDKKTVLNALGRLVEAGYIKRRTHDASSGATQYALCPPLSPPTSPTKRSGPCIGSGGGLGNHDVWHYRALGKTCQAIWHLLLDEEDRTEKEIAAATGRGIGTIRRNLEKLERRGLALHIGHYWQGQFAQTHILDSIAAQCGTQGRAQARRQQHETERSQWVSAFLLRQKACWNLRQEAAALPPTTGGVLAGR